MATWLLLSINTEHDMDQLWRDKSKVYRGSLRYISCPHASLFSLTVRLKKPKISTGNTEKTGRILEWKEAYATGIAEIDRQHKALFDYVDDFREVLENGCSSETYKGVLEFLKLYSESHFGFEEECMLAHKCPAACKNKKEHSLFLNVVKKETEYFEAHGFSAEKALRLMDVIDNWLDSHICRVDVQLKDCIK